MRFANLCVIIGLLSVAAFAPQVRASEGERVFDIPRIENIVIDATPADWGEGGFHVKATTFRVIGGASPPAADDCELNFRLAWNDKGLLLWVTIRDEIIREYPSIEKLWEMDSLDICISDAPGSANLYQLQIAPGMDGEQTKLRSYFHDFRPDGAKKAKLTAQLAAARIDGGYAIEAMIPWKNLGIVATKGRQVAVQITCFDYDGQGKSYAEARWFPKAGAHEDSNRMCRVRLSDKAGEPVLALASGRYEKLLHPVVLVYGANELAGKAVVVREGDKVLAKAALAKRNGRAEVDVPLAMPPLGATWDRLTVSVDGSDLGSVDIPDAKAHRAEALMHSKIRFQSFCFTGKDFPRADFEHPSLAEELVGPYTVSVQYFDRDFKEVAKPAGPGRYGAIITVQCPGRRFRRMYTLYCISTEDRPLSDYVEGFQAEGDIQLPPQMGLDPQVVRDNSSLLQRYFQRRLKEGFMEAPDSAILLAGLSEAKPGKTSDVFDDLFARDRQWWVTLKRKFYGLEKRYSEPLVCPRPIAGAPATVIHEGTLAEAGMKEDAPEKIDALLSEWAADSDQAFAVCVVRHGVVAFHKAYGTRDGKAMTVTTPSNMASITKLLGGTLLMMAVDRDMLDLEAPIDRLHPAFAGIEVKTPLTIRLLCNHWSGMSGHWREMRHDLGEIIASGYASLKVNERYEYNSVDIELAGKLLELVTGEALPQFYKKHLIDPLGLKHTRTHRMGFGTRSVPMDMATIGQMLLNRGAYGNKRFFSEATFEKMLPEAHRRGIGTASLGGSGLSDKTFGHPAGSNATIRIDPENDLVIVMCRNSAGRNFNKYHDRFLQAVADSMETD